MGQLKDYVFPITTSAGGAYSQVLPARLGKLFAVKFYLGTLTSGAVDITLSYTGTPDGLDVTLLTLTNLAASKVYYPRELCQGNTGSDLTGIYDGALVAGQLKCVVAQDAGTHAGMLIVYLDVG